MKAVAAGVWMLALAGCPTATTGDPGGGSSSSGVAGGSSLGGGSSGTSAASSTGRPSSGASMASSARDGGVDAGTAADAGEGDGGIACAQPMAPPAGVVFAPEFASLYHVFEMGPVPGVPSPLGGCVILRSDPYTLWIAGESERSTGGLYRIGVRRDNCGHIVAFDGTAQRVLDVPSIDANLVELANGTLLYTGWPNFLFGQLDLVTPSLLFSVDLTTLGQTGSSAGGLGQVPAAVTAGAGGLRVLGWPDGQWHEVNTTTADGGVLAVQSVAATGVTLPNGPGGVAYVPAASAGFPVQSIMVAEWSADKVATYEVDSRGDPVVSTRRDFFTAFPKPWGAYFEPETGDYLFLTWGRSGVEDSLFRVQGFLKPPTDG